MTMDKDPPFSMVKMKIRENKLFKPHIKALFFGTPSPVLDLDVS